MNPETDARRPKLTRFLTQELLFEYISGSLHPARHRLVDEFLEGDRESQRELLSLSKGLEYAAEISRLQVTPALHDALLNFEPVWKKRLRAWSLWSWRRGWRALPYAFGATAIVLGLLVAKPWARRAVPRIELAEFAHHEPRALEKSPDTPAPPEVRALASTAAEATSPKPSTAAGEPKAVTMVATSPAAIKPVAMTASGLRRGEVVVPEFSKTWPIIRDKIAALEGKAAGNVELGWLRRRDESYFHFAVPQSNWAELERFLNTFGRVQIHQEKSSRVMPEGQIRIILIVKDGGSNEGKAKTP